MLGYRENKPSKPGLALNAVHVFMNICSRSLFTNSVQKRTRCERAVNTLRTHPREHFFISQKRGRRRRRRPLFWICEDVLARRVHSVFTARSQRVHF